jgi:twitching motility two-component system response regulator PilG
VSQVETLSLLQEGIAAARAGNKPLTRQLLRQVTELDPDNEVAWLWLAGAAESPRAALECLERVLEINPRSERARTALRPVRFQAGVEAAKAKDKALARRLLTQVTEQDPENEGAWLWLAGVTDEPAEAVAFLEKVLRINPDNERAKAGIAWHRSQTAPPAPPWSCPLCEGKAEAPRDTCPTCGAVLTLARLEAVGNSLHLKPDLVRGAIERLAPLLRGQPDFATHFYLGLAHLNLRQLDEAVGQLQAALKLRPADRALAGQVNALLQRRAAEAASRTRAGKDRARQRSILVVDDSPTIRKLVTMTMENSGHRVTAAADGYEAVDRIREKGVPDLILLDITMPGMDGYQLCKLLRQNKDTAQVPVVLLSGKDGFINKVRGKMAGSTDFITKPFKPEALVQVVDKYCARPAARAAGAR